MHFVEFIALFLASIPAAIIVALSSLTQVPPYTLKNTFAKHTSPQKKAIVLQTVGVTKIPLPTNTPILLPTRLPQITNTQQQQQTNQESNDWGIAKQIGEHTYTIKVDYDSTMASAQDIFNALNTYRQTHGKGTLNWDQKLADYAQTRANTFQSSGTTDAHAGFENFLNNEDGFAKMGYNRLGENSYYGGGLTGTHLIEWVFAQSPAHNANQLDDWSSVGIGVNDTAVNLNFGGH